MIKLFYTYYYNEIVSLFTVKDNKPLEKGQNDGKTRRFMFNMS